MTVKSDGNEIIIKGLKGPLKEPVESKIVPDNKTFTDVDMGRTGGIRKTTAELKVSLKVYTLTSLINAAPIFIIFDLFISNVSELDVCAPAIFLKRAEYKLFFFEHEQFIFHQILITKGLLHIYEVLFLDIEVSLS